jgi:hypothetical protein
MLDHLTAHWPPAIKNRPAHTRRCAIGAAIVTPFCSSACSAAPIRVHQRTAPTREHQRTAALPDAPRCRPRTTSPHRLPEDPGQFAGSRWPDLRTAGTAYLDLAVQLRTARGTDGYQTVWFTQRLSTACARHGRTLNDST